MKVHLKKHYEGIVLPENCREEIQKVAQKYPGLEVSGFLIGKCQKDKIHVDQLLFGNRRGWKERYFILETSLLAGIGSDPLSVTSVFHAHPKGPLLPSLWDMKSMMITNVPWVIFKIGIMKLNFKGYAFIDGFIEKIPIGK